jgi:hypothetical protein
LYVLSKTTGKVELQIALALILNINVSLIGQTDQLVKVGSTEIPNQRTLGFLCQGSSGMYKNI